MSLLKVPREIRQEIFRQIIYAPVEPISAPSISPDGRHGYSPAPLLGREIWRRWPSNPALSLLLVNKQTHEETVDVLSRVVADYNLDIVHTEEYGLWVSWPIIPALPRTRYVESVTATFRIPESKTQTSSRSRSDREISIRSIWPFYSLLVGLIRSGPGYMKLDQRTAGPLSPNSYFFVKKIIVDIVVDPDCTQPNRNMSQDSDANPESMRTSGFEALPGQDYAKFIVDKMSKLLELGYHTIDYGDIIVENVQDSISFFLNGQDYQIFDLESIVRDHSIIYWGKTESLFEQRKQNYKVWKDWVDERRRRIRHGLTTDDERPVSGKIMCG